jgi:hypothetical protein
MFIRKLILALSYPLIATVRLGLAHAISQFVLLILGSVGFYASKQLLANIIDPLSPWSALNAFASALAAFLIFCLLFPAALFTYRREPSQSDLSAETVSLVLVRFFPVATLTAFGILVSVLLLTVAGAGLQMVTAQTPLFSTLNSRLAFGISALLLGCFCTAVILPKIILTPFVGLIRECQARAAYMTASAIVERSVFGPFFPGAIVLLSAYLFSISAPWFLALSIWYACITTMRMVQFELEHLRLKHLELLKDSSKQVPETLTYVGGRAHITGSRARSTIKLRTPERDSAVGGIQS